MRCAGRRRGAPGRAARSARRRRPPRTAPPRRARAGPPAARNTTQPEERRQGAHGRRSLVNERPKRPQGALCRRGARDDMAVRRAFPLCSLRKLRALLSTASTSVALSVGRGDSSRSTGVLASPFSSARHRAVAAACSAAAAADSVWLSKRERPPRGRGPSTTAPSKRSGGGDPPACITPHRPRAIKMSGRARSRDRAALCRCAPPALHSSARLPRALGAAMPPRRPTLRPVLDLEVLDLPLPGEDGMPVLDDPFYAAGGEHAQRRPRVRHDEDA